MITGSRLSSSSAVAPAGPDVTVNIDAEDVLLRASAEVWDFEEPEGKVKPGERRPFRVIDEQVVHLANTTRKFTHSELRQAVENIVRRLNVPVDVKLAKTRWLYDTDKETRERVVAQLSGGHRFSDVKMLLGVDYLGDWATIHMNLAMEPERLPQEPEEEEPKPSMLKFLLLIPLVLLGVGAAVKSVELIGLGVVSAPVLLFIVYASWQRGQKERLARRQEWQRELKRRREERQLERAVRSFKVDDLRLFRSAMEEVFKQVVDGIQRQGGDIVHRVEGAHGLLGEQRGTISAPAQEAAAEI